MGTASRGVSVQTERENLGPVNLPEFTRAGDRFHLSIPATPCPACTALPAKWRAIHPPSNGCSPAHGVNVRYESEGLTITVSVSEVDQSLRDLLAYLTLRAGTSPAPLAAFWDQPHRWGVQDPSDLGQVLLALNYLLLVEWRPEEVAPFVRAGMERPAARRWNRSLVRDPFAWIAAGVREPDDAERWQRHGGSPQVARQFRDVAALVFAQNMGAPHDPAWGALVGVAGPMFGRFCREAGRTPGQAESLARLLVPDRERGAQFRRSFAEYAATRPHSMDRHLAPAWPDETDRLMTQTARDLPDVDWDDLSICQAAGMSLDEAVAFLRAGGDMAPVRVMAAMHR